jgi:hypothetical protein
MVRNRQSVENARPIFSPLPRAKNRSGIEDLERAGVKVAQIVGLTTQKLLPILLRDQEETYYDPN